MFTHLRSMPYQASITYSMSELIRLQTSPLISKPNIAISSELKIRKRGRKGDIKTTNKNRLFKPYLLNLIFGNIQSIRNKMDELCGNVGYHHNLRTCSVVCFSETWLTLNDTKEHVKQEEYKLFASDSHRL